MELLNDMGLDISLGAALEFFDSETRSLGFNFEVFIDFPSDFY